MLNGNRMKSHRARSPRDLYETPPEFALSACRKLFSEHEILSDSVFLDAGCGNGVWMEALEKLSVWPSRMIGIDINTNFSGNGQTILEGDFLDWNKGWDIDIVIGNPPYSLDEEFIRHSFDLIRDRGYVYFLLRLSFLEGIKRCRGLFKEFPLKKIYVCSRRPSFFSSDGEHHTTDTLAYAMFLWQKGFKGETKLGFLDWDYK